MGVPERYPNWMNEADMAVYRGAFARGGWRGPLNRYRAQDLDFAQRGPVKGRRIEQPAAFIAGSLDPVRHFVPGVDMFAAAGAACDDFRGADADRGGGALGAAGSAGRGERGAGAVPERALIKDSAGPD